MVCGELYPKAAMYRPTLFISLLFTAAGNAGDDDDNTITHTRS